MGLHLERLSDIVSTVAEPDASNAPMFEVKGGITLRDLSFRYGAADPLVLQGVDFDVNPANSSLSRDRPAAANPP